MKKYLLILLALMAFVACEDGFEPVRELESYTLDELTSLSEGFDVSQIDHDQLIADLMQGAMWNVHYLGTWKDEENAWVNATIYGGVSNVNKWIFDENGEAKCCYSIQGWDTSGAPSTTFHKHIDAKWHYEPKTGEIVVVMQYDEPKEYRLKVLYYKSPILFFIQPFLAPVYDNTMRGCVTNLRAVMKEQVEKEFEDKYTN